MGGLPPHLDGLWPLTRGRPFAGRLWAIPIMLRLALIETFAGWPRS
jgi:hypothetical protein